MAMASAALVVRSSLARLLPAWRRRSAGDNTLASFAHARVGPAHL